MLVQEPMLAACVAYMSLVYGILYLNFVAYPVRPFRSSSVPIARMRWILIHRV